MKGSLFLVDCFNDLSLQVTTRTGGGGKGKTTEGRKWKKEAGSVVGRFVKVQERVGCWGFVAVREKRHRKSQEMNLPGCCKKCSVNFCKLFFFIDGVFNIRPRNKRIKF